MFSSFCNKPVTVIHLAFVSFSLSLQCVKQYLSVMITEGNVLAITCPDAECKKQGKLDAQEVRKLLPQNHSHLSNCF